MTNLLETEAVAKGTVLTVGQNAVLPKAFFGKNTVIVNENISIRGSLLPHRGFLRLVAAGVGALAVAACGVESTVDSREEVMVRTGRYPVSYDAPRIFATMARVGKRWYESEYPGIVLTIPDVVIMEGDKFEEFYRTQLTSFFGLPESFAPSAEQIKSNRVVFTSADGRTIALNNSAPLWEKIKAEGTPDVENDPFAVDLTSLFDAQRHQVEAYLILREMTDVLAGEGTRIDNRFDIVSSTFFARNIYIQQFRGLAAYAFDNRGEVYSFDGFEKGLSVIAAKEISKKQNLVNVQFPLGDALAEMVKTIMDRTGMNTHRLLGYVQNDNVIDFLSELASKLPDTDDLVRHKRENGSLSAGFDTFYQMVDDKNKANRAIFLWLLPTLYAIHPTFSRENADFFINLFLPTESMPTFDSVPTIPPQRWILPDTESSLHDQVAERMQTGGKRWGALRLDLGLLAQLAHKNFKEGYLEEAKRARDSSDSALHRRCQASTHRGCVT